MSLPVNTSSLTMELRATLTEIDRQIEAVKLNAEKYIATLPYPDRASVYQIQNPDGRYVLAELLIAKSQLLASITSLQSSSTRPGPRR